MLFVVSNYTSGMVSNTRCIIFAEQVTIPDGMVKGPERVLPRNSVFNGPRNSKSVIEGTVF